MMLCKSKVYFVALKRGITLIKTIYYYPVTLYHFLCCFIGGYPVFEEYPVF